MNIIHWVPNLYIEEILNIIAEKTYVHKKIFILKKYSLETYEAYKINNYVVKMSGKLN